MRHCSPFCAGIWPFILFPLLLLLPVLFFNWHSIEDKVASNAMNELSAQKSWVDAETYNKGRDVLLIGTAPDEQSIESAISAAARGEGVRTVRFHGDIVAPTLEDPELNISFSGDSIVLNGIVGEQSEIDQIVSAVKSNFSNLQLVNKLKLGSRDKPSTAWTSLIGALTNLGNGGKVSIDGDELTLNGTLKSRQHREFVESQFRSAFTGTIDNQLIVEAPKNTCESQIVSLLAKAKINFDTGKASIRPESDELIKNLAESAKKCPYKEFEVSGHTDSTGGLDANMLLSELRAQALVERLVDLGLEQSRFSSKGLGPNIPIADNATLSGRAANRRIEFKVTN